ncbi:hypothetical protein AA313_de0206924 [Arthrobotrys entomopaga]|nr:hypothetical protein AA313_de0206924 [Arthrobotrys entomopaga]
MAAPSSTATTTSQASQIHQLALPLPRTADTSLHLHLTIASRHILLFLTTTTTSANPSLERSILSVPGVNTSSITTSGEDVLNPIRAGDSAVPRGNGVYGFDTGYDNPGDHGADSEDIGEEVAGAGLSWEFDEFCGDGGRGECGGGDGGSEGCG